MFSPLRQRRPCNFYHEQIPVQWPHSNVSVFFAAHGMDVDDPLLDNSDVLSHLMNGYCAGHATPACSEVSRRIKSPVKMAVAVTEIVIDGYSRQQLSTEGLRATCSAVGIKPESHC
jgi:hypothetical protein